MTNSQALDQSTSPLTDKLDPFVALQDLQDKFNALLAKLDSNHGAATNHVATLGITTTIDQKPRAV